MNYADFAATARSQKPSNNLSPLVPETNAPAQQITRQFQFQSYFDSALLERALLTQDPNQSIVQSTLKPEQIPGYALGLAPWSQTPVAVQFTVGGQATSSGALLLKPGEIIRPFGLPPGVKTGAFTGFNWGLPFGWLGGGIATLLVFQTPDSDVAWPGIPELIFHRQRMRIYAPGDAPANAPLNWPLRFPWVQALRGAAPSVSQQGQPALAVEPTKVRMSLRLDALASASDMRIEVQGSNDFDLDPAGTPFLTPVRFKDMTWGTYASSASFGVIGNLASAFPVQFMPDELVRLSTCDGFDSLNTPNVGGFALIDLSGNLSGGEDPVFVDICRYGRL